MMDSFSTTMLEYPQDAVSLAIIIPIVPAPTIHMSVSQAEEGAASKVEKDLGCNELAE